MTALHAYEALQATILFCVGYAWQDQIFGELTGDTVVSACDAQAALESFRSRNPHITRAWIISSRPTV